MSSERAHIIFKGSVQGVGFRYTAAHIAGAYDVSGYVKNLSDGSVEVIAEGEVPAVSEFVGEVQKQMSHYIRSTDAKRLPATGEYSGFGVRY